MTLGSLVGGAHARARCARARRWTPAAPDCRFTGVTHDSRAVVDAAWSSSPFAASAPTARRSPPRPCAAARRRSSRKRRRRPGITVPWLRTPDARLALAELAGILYGQPSEALTVVGVTGTNGKTTTTYLLAAVFDAAGMPCGRIGTVTVRVGPDAGRRARRVAHDAGSAGGAAAAARNGGPRLQGVRDGSVVARAGAAARGRRALRARPSSRISRAITSTSTSTCSSTSPPSGGCSKCCRPARPRSSTSTIPWGQELAASLPTRRDLRHSARGRRPRRRRFSPRSKAWRFRSRRRRACCRCGRRWSAGRTSTTSSASSPPRIGARRARAGHRSRHRATRRRARPLPDGVGRRPTTCASSSTTRTPTMR